MYYICKYPNYPVGINTYANLSSISIMPLVKEGAKDTRGPFKLVHKKILTTPCQKRKRQTANNTSQD